MQPAARLIVAPPLPFAALTAAISPAGPPAGPEQGTFIVVPASAAGAAARKTIAAPPPRPAVTILKAFIDDSCNINSWTLSSLNG